MGTAAQKKKLFDGMSAKNAKKKIVEIWNRPVPKRQGFKRVNFNRVNKDFIKTHAISLLGLCETWHRLRAQNKTVELLIQTFASTIVTKNAKERQLVEAITQQRARLAQLEKIVADNKRADELSITPGQLNALEPETDQGAESQPKEKEK